MEMGVMVQCLKLDLSKPRVSMLLRDLEYELHFEDRSQIA